MRAVKVNKSPRPIFKIPNKSLLQQIFIYFSESSSLWNIKTAIMERPDGKNPLDPETYNTPAPNIQTMIELRAFCAAFFQERVRRRADVDEEDVRSFLALIVHSPSYYARAHAVIPELQLSDAESCILGSHVKAIVCTARAMMGLQPDRWELLPEEPAWAELIQAGMKTFVNDVRAHKKHLSDQSSGGSPSKQRIYPAASAIPLIARVPSESYCAFAARES